MQPTFLVIGTAKSGTTSLHRYLDQHPDICMSAVKEAFYFLPQATWKAWVGPGDQRLTHQYVTDAAAYEALFAEARPDQARGETSPLYYLYPEIIPHIQAQLPGVRLVVLMRDPVTRAFSNFLHQRREEVEPRRRFERALAEEGSRLAAGWRPFWGYRDQGRYAHHLRPWVDAFGDRIHFMALEDLHRDPVSQMRSLFRFLGVDDAFAPDTRARYNISGEVRSKRVRSRLISKRPLGGLTRYLLPHGTRRWLAYRLQRINTRYPEMRPETRDALIEYFAPDTGLLEEMVGRPMPWISSKRQT